MSKDDISIHAGSSVEDQHLHVIKDNDGSSEESGCPYVAGRFTDGDQPSGDEVLEDLADGGETIVGGAGPAETEIEKSFASAPASLAVAESAGIATNKPEIFTAPGMHQGNIDTAEKLLAGTGRFFLRHGTIVVIQEDASTGKARMREASKHVLFAELDSLAKWLRQSRGSWVPAHPPDRVCTGLLQSRTHRHLPALTGFAHQPFFRPDGSLVLAPGFDSQTGLYADFDPRAYPIASAPTKEAVKDAIVALDQVLEEFRFRTPLDRSAAMSAMITAATRSSLDAAPLYHVRAHQAGTGKSYLCRLIAALASADTPQAATFPTSEVECAKVVLAALRDAPAVIEFDNLTTDLLPHASLCSSLTAEKYTGRKLGYSEMDCVSTRTLFLSSGNNVGPVGDMCRRTITIDLDAGCDLPAARTFAVPQLLEIVRESREEYVTYALTLVQAWLAAGRPDGGARPVASFGQWSDLCRLPLLWLGKLDPAEAVFTAMQDDPHRTLVGRVLRCLHEQFGSTPVQVRDVVKRAQDVSAAGSAELLEALQEATESSALNNRRLGRWLLRNVGHVVGDLRLAKVSVSRNAAVWIVEKT